MKNTENFKIFWWFVLVFVIGFYLFGRWDKLIEGKPSYLDAVVFIIWVGVCLAPIFQEMDIFGVKLKQQVDDLKKDLSHQLSIMKTEIKSSIEVSNANQNTISVNTTTEPPRDSELPQLEEAINKILESKGLSNSTIDLPEPNSISVEMFKIRAAFEQLISKCTYENIPISGIHFAQFSNVIKRPPLSRVLNELKKSSLISHDVLNGISEVISICNYAIHGEELSEKQIDFVRKSSPNLYKALENEFSNPYL
ncbi:hypothetical protein [uncultured Tolumonas sp.]|uniref:hypothetical protein n=1 Tax=uncultured Tolumonas sp. TaxID=263765 RepID=UPI002A0A9514|nr:hypothetical protein [uncultured Tolumonas sp.]